MPGMMDRVRAVVRTSPRLDAGSRWARQAWPLRIPRTRRRRGVAQGYYDDKLAMARAWAPQWTEDDNFYYDLTVANRADLASLVASVCGIDPSVAEGYATELASDLAIREHILTHLSADSYLRDVQVGFGRREGWYAFVRALKPRVVVETGVHHGVGACVIAAALLRNEAEGFLGRYIGTEIDPNAGFLLSGVYASVGEIRVGDSVATLRSLTETVDLFINDSDHSGDYEALEYAAITPRLSDRSLVLGDNSHVTPRLRDYARAQARPYLFFREEPLDHWYPGAGVGVSPSVIPLLAPA